jgi:MMP 1-O-methyltransferase
MAPAMAPIPELRKRLDDLPGWLSYEEGETLYRLAERCTGRGVIVEIGSWRGKSTTCLGLGSKAGRGVHVYAVDRHTDGTFPDWQRNVEAAGIADLVTPIKGLSQEVAAEFDQPIELLFIDGAHQYELVRQDFERWVPKVVDGGYVALHDTLGFEGPSRVADELLYGSRHFKDARFVFPTTALARKVPQNAPYDRLRNRYAMGVKRSVQLVRKAGGQKRLPRPLQQLGRRLLGTIQ